MKTKTILLIVVLFSIVTTIRAVTYPTRGYVPQSQTRYTSRQAATVENIVFYNISNTQPLPIGANMPRRVVINGFDDEDEDEERPGSDGDNGGTPGGGNDNENITPIGSALLPLLLLALGYGAVVYRRKLREA